MVFFCWLSFCPTNHQGHHLNLLLFVDDQEASTAFLTTFEEAAAELSKYAVQCSTVDVTKHPKVAGKFGVQTFPTLVSVEGKVTVNPYTKQNLRTVKALRERTVKGLKKWALRGKGKRLPHDVQTLANTSRGRRIADPSRASAPPLPMTTARKTQPLSTSGPGRSFRPLF